MREIKFRGKDANTWFYGDLTHHTIIGEDYVGISNKSDTDRNGCATRHMVKPETVGQFYKTTYCGNPTPVDLYEGDIVEGYQPYNEDNPHRGQIIWYNDRFSLLTTNNYIEDLTVFTVTKKLGNIHDNPELLKGGEK